jgi:glycosyltransferase involved in cell wall biosynthesis
MVKDEADVIGGTLAHLADEVDFLLVADNASTDGTREILAELEDQLPLTVIDDPDPAYYQSRKMSDLAERAAGAGADWIVPFDADELWFTHTKPIAKVLDGIRAPLVRANLFDHRPSAIDVDDTDPFRSIVWREPKPAGLPKVAFRWEPGAVIHQGNHGVTLPSRSSLGPYLIEIRHFPYRSAEQFVRKARNGAAAYRATDLPVTEGAHWRQYGDLLDRFGEPALEEVFRTWFWNLAPVEAGLINDPAPYRRWLPS